ncbi:DUF2325 domain-containing protein [Burkholderia pseudomallei]|uniref:DUF2325 domain-containing protein n=1 Tax=Burkholderia pseudomallei TaxID=28450 RepID=UPI000F2D32F9|nr:DUF2325 domain-containing protein [Burkholderia pseudomallei]CAJ3246220.1 Uncharacterised protein [Burkholderia pseudomallei]CAJ8243692.1 Uncharacterised protein [Burkholderia pseudomallei]VBF29596.1 Uncharacterised protein [Burkholderia pseudomallei]
MAHPYMAIQQRANRRMNGAHVDVPIRRVSWTDDELEQVAREAFAVLQADGSLSNMEAVRRAQVSVLSAERHRTIRQERDLTALLPIWADLRAKKTAPPEPTSTPAPEPEPASEPRKGRQTITETRADQRLMLETQIANPTPSKDRKTLVRWSAEEQRKIAVESKRLLNEFEDMSRVEAIRKAIEYTMPTNRQRDISSVFQVPWINDEWKVIDELNRTEREERQARERAAEAERIAEESRRAIEAARAEAEKAKTIDPASLPLETLIGALGTRIAGMLLRSIGEQLQESIMQRITEALGNVTLPSPGVLPEGATRMHAAPRDRKPRVLIVGLVRQQEDDVRRALGELFRFDYVRVEHADNLEEKARGADLVVLMTKFISHKHQDIVRRVNEHIVYRNGGVTELKRWLTQWINGEVIPATA